MAPKADNSIIWQCRVEVLCQTKSIHPFSTSVKFYQRIPWSKRDKALRYLQRSAKATDGQTDACSHKCKLYMAVYPLFGINKEPD